jgi:staphylococcal nuclease domain-containing protein 1
MNLTISFKLNEKRQFGTIAVGKRPDVGEVLVIEGLAVTQHHRDDEEKSPRYDALVAAEAAAKIAKKGVHSDKEYKSKTVNDLSEPRKAKSYSGSLVRAGRVKAIVEYVFNGSRYKLLVPSENCQIVFALENLKSPQPSAPASVVSRGQGTLHLCSLSSFEQLKISSSYFMNYLANQ